MKTILALTFFVILLISTGCQNYEADIVESTSANIEETIQNTTIKDTAVEETTEVEETLFPYHNNNQKLTDTLTDIDDIYATEQATVIQSDNPQVKYNLTDEDMEIVRALFDQRYKWETKRDEETAEYTSEAFNVYYLNMFYDGEKIMFVPFYIYASGPSTSMRAHQLTTAFYLDSTNQLIELPDYDVSVGAFGTDSSVAQMGYIARVSSDEEKIDNLAEFYSKYKKITG